MARRVEEDPRKSPEAIARDRIQEALRSRALALDLSTLGLTALPDSLGQLTQLQHLDVSDNGLRALPKALGQLTDLSLLEVSGNRLTELPRSLEMLTKCKRLHLYRNQLERLPEFIGNLHELESLALASNPLHYLPESVSGLANLKSLSLAGTAMTGLPESLRGLTGLEYLALGGTPLVGLPEWIGELGELKGLDVSNGETVVWFWEGMQKAWSTGQRIGPTGPGLIKPLPESLRNLSRLQELYLHGNDSLGLPPEILGPKWHEVNDENSQQPAKPAQILDYYFRTRGGGSPLNEAKLILVGRGGVGKTCVVNRLVRDTFDKDERKTDGIRITQWKVTLNATDDVRLNIWDFGGQEIMHSTHQFFLTQRSLYLLVLNGREGGEDAEAEYWLQLIESFGGESPVIVVLNKIKEQPFDLNRRALQQKYAAIRDFIETDCGDEKVGLDRLEVAIRRETDQLEGLRDRFPASWFAVKDRLAGMKENYLSFEKYRELCEQLGERDPDAQEQLAANMHRLGIALNFKDDPRLRDTHVLNPHWITNGIYKILNADRLEKQKGVLRLSDLPGILQAKDYPAAKHLFLLDLMKKFELCFEFPDDVEHRYLVPELLDKQEPDLKGEFQPKECLNFQYHYNIVPEGLLPRFIVRTHVLSPPELRWRTGVVLAFEGNRALVKADVRDRRVSISVTGPAEGRRRLLAVIRSDFEAIHRDIRKLQVTEMVPVSGRPETVVSYGKLKVLEQSRVPRFHEVIDNAAVELDVQEMLNGVDLEGTRRRAASPEGEKPLRVFISYSHKDETLQAELETHLKLLQRQGLISVWNDRKIAAGEEWKGKIDENLESADIILLLVSADFVASDYCYDLEMTRALERHEAETATVIPVILRDVDWQSAPFAKLQALPKEGKPVTLCDNKDSAWKDVATGIRKEAERLRPHT